jgi:hypothetical protein
MQSVQNSITYKTYCMQQVRKARTTFMQNTPAFVGYNPMFFKTQSGHTFNTTKEIHIHASSQHSLTIRFIRNGTTSELYCNDTLHCNKSYWSYNDKSRPSILFYRTENLVHCTGKIARILVTLWLWLGLSLGLGLLSFRYFRQQ